MLHLVADFILAGDQYINQLTKCTETKDLAKKYIPNPGSPILLVG